MSSLIRLAEYRRQHRVVFFSRRELNQLLSLYSRRVMRGEWRDYAIDHRPGMAMFSVFRSSRERPLFSIAKRVSLTGPASEREAEFLLLNGRHRLGRASLLEDIIEQLESGLRVVG
ncbi:MAG TPA: DUF2794 domain-containing protein [Hypericibacter adhaerens]|jgi:hypothetical protein|uniref:DUF2794 domain-containing protein n=1 Tax=Hypericibacter adhaerens TaxID=2602016 RepID=A0A5J6N2H3_9PROT|nr:DUF2794 domain-containing protein [Hypericibacter adhaerens]QEX23185.1 hypothetical protein FRZ61_31200 [Hypericibacter adhaerens]HWA44652.1 DUF2794 domain-containing protein [Hypericibacter adhaerens]